MSKIFRLIFSLAIIAIHFETYSQELIDPYAITDSSESTQKSIVIELNSAEINVLSGMTASVSNNLKKTVKNHMFLWTSVLELGASTLKWKVKVEQATTYEITGVVYGGDAKFKAVCNNKSNPEIKVEKGWSRIPLGRADLKKGMNEIIIKIESDKPTKLSAIELTTPFLKKKLLDKALRSRKNPDWFKDAGYGLMFQWTNRSTPISGDTLKKWEDKVNDFDLDAFVELVGRSGARYVIWSITWGQQYISAPIESLNKILTGRTSKRDLLGEMADRFYEKGIKLIFYYHYGYDCYHSKDSLWMDAAGGYLANKSELYRNVSMIISEVGNRYGNKLSGWFLDGSQRYYDSHFDGQVGGVLSAPFQSITKATRTGNNNRVIAYNSWRLPLSTEFQDYYAGEGLQEFNNLDDGVFSSGKHAGLMAHSCFPLEKRWGHVDWNTEISEPKYTIDELVKRIAHAKKNRYPLSINLEMYEDGTISPNSYNLLVELKDRVKVILH